MSIMSFFPAEPRLARMATRSAYTMGRQIPVLPSPPAVLAPCSNGLNKTGKLSPSKGAFMGNETFKKRQKELARKEKQQKKAARRIERRNEQGRTEDKDPEKDPTGPESVSQHGPTILYELDFRKGTRTQAGSARAGVGDPMRHNFFCKSRSI